VTQTPASTPAPSLFGEECFRHIVESLEDCGIFTLDRRGHVQSWNAGARRLLGYGSAEIMGRHVTVLFPPDALASGACARALGRAERAGSTSDEGWLVRQDGGKVWVSIELAARSAAGNPAGFAVVLRDLSERKKAAEERLRLVQMQQTDRLKDEFLATISHELRTPLHAILGWANLLRERLHEPDALKAAETILRNAEAQAHIIDDVLDVSRIITGKFKLELKTADLSAIVRESLDVVRPSAAARRVSLSFEHDDQPYQLIADPTRLSQVVWNLLSNAVKFSEAGGSVVVRLSQRGSLIEIGVRDTGRGIDAEFLPYVFDRFRQAEGSTKRRFGGLGLGLAIVREIVELHGGETWAESDGLGLGAAFHVRLPVRAVRPASDDDHASPRTIRELVLPSVRLDGLRVLVVDDEPDARELLAELLEGRGAESFSADCAAEARRAIAIARPHVIISDIAMPEEDGYDFIRSVRALATQHGGTTPAIALTAHARREDRVRALGAGFTSYVHKPVDVEELIRLVQNLGRPQPEKSPT
jgi:PAS domain S-box-containing protein